MTKRETRPTIEEEEEGGSVGKRPPYPKRKVAIMMGYCGSNYQGMQLNPNAKTIELELFKALCRDGLISEDNAVDPKKISWMRACRTDKGVHAAGQVVSVKLLVKTEYKRDEECSSEQSQLLEADALDASVPRLNAVLPSDIRVFGIKRTSNSFHAKERCDSRFYEYLLPTYSLAPASADPYLNPTPRPFEDDPIPIKQSEQPKKSKSDDSDDEAEGLERAEEVSTAGVSTTDWLSKLTDAEKALIKDYRIDSDRLGILRELLRGYEGSKMYHNFTIGKSFSDFSARRNIMEVRTGEPFIHDGIEWLSLVFHGQSFMLHQIRKMVGLAILCIRLDCDHIALLDHCFQRVKVNIPKAPALGLLLDKSVFTSYSKKFAGSREELNFDEFEEQRERLKDELIYPKIFAEEQQFNRFMGWLKCNDEHASEFGFLIPFIKGKRAAALKD